LTRIGNSSARQLEDLGDAGERRKRRRRRKRGRIARRRSDGRWVEEYETV